MAPFCWKRTKAARAGAPASSSFTYFGTRLRAAQPRQRRGFWLSLAGARSLRLEGLSLTVLLVLLSQATSPRWNPRGGTAGANPLAPGVRASLPSSPT